MAIEVVLPRLNSYKIRSINRSNPHILRLMNMRKFKGEVVRRNWKCSGDFGILIGSSTGGPSSLEQVIPRLPGDYLLLFLLSSICQRVIFVGNWRKD